MPKHGKRYREQYAKVDRERQYSPAEAIRLIKDIQSAKFAETVEAHIRTGLNVRHADEQLRGTITLPHAAGRDVTIAVFAKGAEAAEAPRPPAPTTSATRTSPSASRKAGPTSTWRSRRRT